MLKRIAVRKDNKRKDINELGGLQKGGNIADPVSSAPFLYGEVSHSL